MTSAGLIRPTCGPLGPSSSESSCCEAKIAPAPSRSATTPIATSTRGWVAEVDEPAPARMRRQRGALHRDPLERWAVVRDPGRGGDRRLAGRRRPDLGGVDSGLAEDQLELALGVVETLLAAGKVGAGVVRLAVGPLAEPAHVAPLREVERDQQDRSDSAARATKPVTVSKSSETCTSAVRSPGRRGVGAPQEPAPKSASSAPITSASGAFSARSRTSPIIGVTSGLAELFL